MTDEQLLALGACQHRRQFEQMLGNPLDALNRLGLYAAAAQQPSKFDKARAYAAAVRARKGMVVRRVVA